MATADLRVRITGDVAKLERGLDSASRRLGAFGDKASKLGGTLTTRLTLPIVALGGVAIKAAGDLNESISKVDNVFKTSAPTVQAWAKTTTEAFKISRQEALEAAGTFGNLFIALGTAEPAAAAMSQRMVELAGDLASFNNVNVEDALLALRSGLVGEAEPLRKFGVSLSEARIQAVALSSGLVKAATSTAKIEKADRAFAAAQKEANKAIKKFGEDSTQGLDAIIKMEEAEKNLQKALAGEKIELTAAQKAQAAYKIILEDTKLAQGDAAKTGDQFAGQMRELQARFKDTAGELGTRLLPVATRFLGSLTKMLDKFSGLSPGMQDFIIKGAAIAAVLGPAIKVTGGVAKGIGGIVGAAKKIGGVLGILKQGKDAICAPAGCADHLGGASGRAAGKVSTLGRALGGTAAAAAGTAIVLDQVAKDKQRISREAQDNIKWMFQETKGWQGAQIMLRAYSDTAKGTGAEQARLALAIKSVGGSLADYETALAAGGTSMLVFAAQASTLEARLRSLDRIVANSTFIHGDPGGAFRGDFPSGRGGSGGAARAHGGPVTGGRPYLVGERGPELFVPNGGGQVVPNHQLGRGGGSGGVTVHINGPVIAGQGGLREAARLLAKEIEREIGQRAFSYQRAG